MHNLRGDKGIVKLFLCFAIIADDCSYIIEEIIGKTEQISLIEMRHLLSCMYSLDLPCEKRLL